MRISLRRTARCGPDTLGAAVERTAVQPRLKDRSRKALRCFFAPLAALALAGATPAAEPDELVIFNWSQYLAPEVVAAFEAETGARVRVVHYGGDDHRDQLMVETDGEGFDVIVVSGTTIETYGKRGWIQPLQEELIPNLRHIDPRWRDAYAATREYAVPYFWGTVGIAYRRDLVPEPITSWMQLYRPAPELQGRIKMPNTARDVLGMALKALGHSMNTDDPEKLKEAGRLALAQKPAVSVYSYISLGEGSALVSGKTAAAMVYGGDALNVAQHHEDIVYVLPEEGGGIWCDYLTVGANAPHPELAHEFIDFINRPDIAAQQAEYMYLGSPNRAARERIDPEILSNPIVYPDADALAKSEYYRPLSPELLRLQSRIFTHIVE
ncbi:polyamine ABC transporter substrate-binding protein [Arhodomonas sp. AD133]|uniref:polyamine ABC transporter substrate-binding protein n=1 Tax=Arhodomonas sp. AD133 TaxID=3415009 RepID=UPI003EB9259D